MRKRIIAAAVGVIAVTAIAWSAVHARQSKIDGKGEVTHASAPMSPHDEMIKRGSSLPVAYWAHPF
jgi:hypothetical protein